MCSTHKASELQVYQAICRRLSELVIVPIDYCPKVTPTTSVRVQIPSREELLVTRLTAILAALFHPSAMPATVDVVAYRLCGRQRYAAQAAVPETTLVPDRRRCSEAG
jgi:hypothetical protein